MYFKVAPTDANRRFFGHKLHRFIIDLFPSHFIVWLNTEDQRAAALEGIQLTSSNAPAEAGALVS